MIPALGLVAVLAACSSSASTAPTTCKKTDRTGVYRVTFSTQSGSCGDLPESLINLDASGSGTAACTVNQQTYASGDCKLTTDETCPIKGGGTNHSVFVTTQETQDGSQIDGAFTIQISGTTADCTGTYGIKAVRQ